jgi:NADPH2:quinone reductase
MSGTVERLGAAVRDFRIGEPVYVSARELPQRCGCYAQYITVDAAALLRVSPGADLEAVGALSSYQVAWHLLESATGGFRYETVLVTAAAGGIGSACVQLAHAAGKRVIAVTSSAEKAAFAREQGADVSLVYSDQDFAANVRVASDGAGADLILDSGGGSRAPTLFELASPLGLVIYYGFMQGWPDGAATFEAMRRRFGQSPALRLFSMHTFDADPTKRRACAEALLALLARGAIRPPIHERIPLAEAARAHALLESGTVLGKLVLKP